MEKIRNRLILLSRVVTRKKLRQLHQDDPTFQQIFHFTPIEISQYFSINPKDAQTLFEQLRNASLKKAVLRDQQISTVITQLDATFPKDLLHIQDPPFVLYCLGDIKLLHHRPMISVVGTRKPSNEAIPKLRKIITPLIQKNWCVVSGLAYGIDSLAHQLTLDYQGKTISVLGGGFHHLYPKANRMLFDQIIDKGLVISEYPPDVKARKYHFPERNRIISGLSMGTLVIEATEHSGTVITVDLALDQGKEVYAVPGSPLIPQTVGCHKMIQDGAKLVISAEDILVDFS